MDNENLRLYREEVEQSISDLDLTDNEAAEHHDESMLGAPLVITADQAMAVIALFQTFPVLQGGSVVKSLRQQLAEIGMEP